MSCYVCSSWSRKETVKHANTAAAEAVAVTASTAAAAHTRNWPWHAEELCFPRRRTASLGCTVAWLNLEA